MRNENVADHEYFVCLKKRSIKVSLIKFHLQATKASSTEHSVRFPVGARFFHTNGSE